MHCVLRQGHVMSSIKFFLYILWSFVRFTNFPKGASCILRWQVEEEASATLECSFPGHGRFILLEASYVNSWALAFWNGPDVCLWQLNSEQLADNSWLAVHSTAVPVTVACSSAFCFLLGWDLFCCSHVKRAPIPCFIGGLFMLYSCAVAY